mgnify:CR=1 FL=1
MEELCERAHGAGFILGRSSYWNRYYTDEMNEYRFVRWWDTNKKLPDGDGSCYYIRNFIVTFLRGWSDLHNVCISN